MDASRSRSPNLALSRFHHRDTDLRNRLIGKVVHIQFDLRVNSWIRMTGALRVPCPGIDF